MKNKELEGNIYLLICAMIWGFAFVAQRVGSGYLPALTFNALRFTLGALSLLPLVIIADKKERPKRATGISSKRRLSGALSAASYCFSASPFSSTA
jgi:drug/metabolite transporter (DMT)-like permease